jgi:hemerythrin-like metal-binding protein
VHSLQWTTDDFVYMPQLDADHQKIFEDTENLRRAVSLGQRAGEMEFCLFRLAKSFSTHLSSEERLMRSSRYPALQWHEHQHDAGRKKLAFLTQAVHRRDVLGIPQALEDLARWFTDHIHLADQMLAAHLRNEERERLAS